MAAPPLGAQDSAAPPAAEETPTAQTGAEEPQDQETEGTEEGEKPLPSFFATTTVTATGSAVDSFEIATPVTVIEALEIERKAVDNASDLLRGEAGVDVNGVGPNQSRPIIRGQRGLRVLFLENGLRMNNARRQTDFGEIPGLVDLNGVQTVEVVRGPASVLYGSDAIGGVLNLITKGPSSRQGGVGGSFGLRWGSAAEQTGVSADVDGRFETVSFRLGASWRDGEDYEAAADTFGAITLDQKTPVVDTGLEDKSVNGYVDVRLGEGQHLFARANVYRADQTGFGFVEPSVLGDDESFRIRILYPFQDFERFTLGYNGSLLGSALADSLEVQAYWQSNERELVNDIDIDIGPIFPGAPNSTVEADTLNFTDLDTLGLRAEAVKVAGGRHLITYGLEFYEDDSFNTDSSVTTTTLRFPFPPFEVVVVDTDDVANAPNAVNSSTGAFAQGELEVSDRLRLTLGARWQQVDTKAEPTPGWDTAGLDFEDDAVVGALNLLWAATDSLHVVGSYGTAFRAPNIVERLFNGLTPEGIGFQILNPDLVSEESDNIDLGLKYRRRNALFELTFFRNDIDNGVVQFFLDEEEIAALPPEVRAEIEASGVTFVVQQRNVERVRNEGVELSIGYHWGDGFAAGGNYTHLDVERLDSENPPTGDAVSDKLNLYFRWNPPRKRYWFEYRLRHNGDEPSTVDPGEPLPPVGDTIPSFTVHALGAGVRLFERGVQEHSLSLVIDNLTDELYAEVSNAVFFRPQPRRNFVASYRLRF